MSISQKSLRSESGFSSPGFMVDTSGNVNITGLFKINNIAIAGGTSLPSTTILSSLTRVGTLTQLSVHGNTTLSNGTVAISSTGTVTINSSITGSMNNIAIGNLTPTTGAFTSLTANTITANTITNLNNLTINPNSLTINPTVSGTMNNVNIGNIDPGTGSFTTLTITTSPTNNTDATTKIYVDTLVNTSNTAIQTYVDTKSVALAIALGS